MTKSLLRLLALLALFAAAPALAQEANAQGAQMQTALSSLAGNGKPLSLVADVFCPSMTCPEGLWKSVCYQDQD